MPVIDIKGLSKTYAGGFQALKRVDLDIQRGEIFALLGPNGAGKTTCFYMIVGLVPADAGRIVLDGTDLLTADRKKRRAMAGTELAIVFQDALTALNPLYTVGRQLTETILTHRPDLGAAGARRRGEPGDQRLDHRPGRVGAVAGLMLDAYPAVAD